MGIIHETFARLPEMAYVWVEGRQMIGVVYLGQHGFIPAQGPHTLERLKLFNEELGVTPQQAEAMMIGSMYGWNTPGVKDALDG